MYLAITCAFLAFLGGIVIRVSETLLAYSSPAYYAQKAYPNGYPYQAVLYMKKEGVPQKMLNEFNWGGYLIWHFPNEKFFIDGRMDNFFINGKSFAWVYWSLMNLKPDWQKLLKDYEIKSVLAPHSWPLVNALREQSGWEVVFEDESSVLLCLKS